MVFAARTGSSAFSTSSRTCSKRSQFLARASSSARSSSAAAGNVAMWTLAGSAAARGKILPHFLRGEHGDRRDQPQQRAGDAVHGGLRGTPPAIFRRERVQAVLEHIEVKRAEVHRAEIVQRVIDAMKFEFVVPIAALARERSQCAGASMRPFPTDLRRPRNRARDRNRKDCRARSGTCCGFCGRLPPAASSSLRRCARPPCNPARRPRSAACPRPTFAQISAG